MGEPYFYSVGNLDYNIGLFRIPCPDWHECVDDVGNSLASEHNFASSLEQSSASAYVKATELIIIAHANITNSLLWGILLSAVLCTVAYLNLILALMRWELLLSSLIFRGF